MSDVGMGEMDPTIEDGAEDTPETSTGGSLGGGNLGDGDVDGIGDDGAADDGLATAMGGPANG